MKALYHAIKNKFSHPKTLVWYMSAPAPVFALVAIMVVYSIAPKVMENLIKETAVDNAVNMTRTLQKIRNYYSQNVVRKINGLSEVQASHLHALSDTDIPIPATFLIEMAQSHNIDDNLKVEVTSPFPFLPRSARKMNDFQTRAWYALQQNPDKPYSQIDTVDGKRLVRVALADTLSRPTCVSCHNSHQDSPKQDWQLNDVRGLIEIEVNVEPWLARANRVALWVVAVCLMAFLSLILFNLRTARLIMRPLHQVSNALTALADKRMVKLETSDSSYQEVSELSQAFLRLQEYEKHRQALENKVQTLAYFDALTQVPNRASMVKYLGESLQHLNQDETLSFIIVNIDKFNEVNDTLGYKVGDQVLQAVAHRIQQLYPAKMVARFNGAEFSIACIETTDSRKNCGTQVDLVEEMQRPFKLSEHQVHLTVSVGIAQTTQTATQAQDIVAHANIALSQAELSSKEKSILYTPALSETLHHRVNMIQQLQYALEHDELQPYFQPQFDLHSGKLIGAEALLRWVKQDGTMVSPAEFIPIAEKSHLILPIGRKVLFDACHLNKSWQKKGLDPFRVAVNVSGIQLDEDDMPSLTRQALEESGLSPQWLELEVTESALMFDINLVIDKLSNLRLLGVELAIDDFGTGYSSLSYLKRLPIDRLKIDQSFVRFLMQDSDDQAIVQMILDLGKSLKLKMIAEGVENQQTRDYLQQKGCDEAQGYFFARPMPADEFYQFARDWQNNPQS